MKHLKLFFALFAMLALGVGNAWGAEETVVYTLTPTAGSNNAYADNCDITISDITWNLTGNSTMIPWRIGGKSLTKVDRTLYSKTAMPCKVTKIEVEHGAASSVTVNSFKLIVASDANFSNVITTVEETFKASAITTLTCPSGADWSNAFYKFVYNVTIGGSNKYILFSGAKFYGEASTTPGEGGGEDPETPGESDDATMTAGTNGTSCTVNGKAGIKVGTSSKGGDMKVTVPAGATMLHVYAAAWNGVNGLSLNITPQSNVTTTSIALTADAGIANNTPFTLSGNEADYLFDIPLQNITAETTLTFTSSTTKRFVVWGATYETAGSDEPGTEETVVKTLQSIAVSGMTTKYETGDEFKFDGTCTATYSVTKNGEPQADETAEVTPTDITKPDMSTAGTKEITVTYTEGEITKTVPYEITVENALPKIVITQNEVADFTNTYAEYTWTASGVSGKIYGYKNSGMQLNSSKGGSYVYNTDPIPGYIRKIKIVKASGTSRNWTPYVSETALTSAEGTKLTQEEVATTTTWEVDGENSYFYLLEEGGATVIESITISYEAVVPQVATPTFTPAAGTYNAVQNVTISAEAGTTIYYTLDGTDPTKESNVYASAIEIGETTTVKAIAVKDEKVSLVASATYTINLPLTTMDQIFAKATAVGKTATPVEITFDNWVVSAVKEDGKTAFVTDGTKGFVIYETGCGFNVGDILSETAACKVELFNGFAELTGLKSTTTGLSVATGGEIIVVELDDDGIAALTGVNTGSLVKINGICTQSGSNYYVADVQVYSSLYDFGTLEVGAEYNITGIYQPYNSTKEILPRSAADIEKVVGLPTATIAIADITMEVGEEKDIEATITPDAARTTVQYAITAGSEYIDLDGTTITAVAAGTATITATIVEVADEYYGTTKTFTVTVKPQNIAELPFTFDGGRDDIETTLGMSQYGLDSDYGSSPKLKFNTTEDYVLIHFNSEPGLLSYDIKGNSFSGGTFEVIESADGETYTEVAGYTELSDVKSEEYALLSTSRFVMFKYTEKNNGNVALGNIKITKPDTRAEAGLAWDPETVTLTVGDAFTAPTFNNPNGLGGITFVSDNETLATVDNAGAITLVNGITGTATITATFADGHADYKPATATCTIMVNEDCEGSDDFETATATNASSYTPRTTEAGWKATNAAKITIEGELGTYLAINGKISAVGTITSPVLNGGIGSIKIRYANTFSESNGVSFRLDIKQDDAVVKTYTITKANSEVVKGTVYTEHIKDINVEGDFQMVFTNLSPTQDTGNKDRVSIGRLCWTGYEIPTYTITATANPAEGGSVSGAGTYKENTNVTLTATPNDSYTFVNWTKAGVEVSTDATYTFTATEDINLVANFEQTTPITPALEIIEDNAVCTIGRDGSLTMEGQDLYVEVGEFDAENILSEYAVYCIILSTWDGGSCDAAAATLNGSKLTLTGTFVTEESGDTYNFTISGELPSGEVESVVLDLAVTDLIVEYDEEVEGWVLFGTSGEYTFTLVLDEEPTTEKEYTLNAEYSQVRYSRYRGFVSGSLTKEYDDTYGDMYVGQLNTTLGDIPYVINLTMCNYSADPSESIELIAEATYTVEDDMLSVVADWEGTPVQGILVGFENVSGQEFDEVWLSVGEGEDEFFISGSAIVTIEDGELAIEGVFSFADEKYYNVYIWGTAPATEPIIPTITLGDGDNSTVIAENEDQTVNVIVDRSFEEGDEWYTLCVPFNMPASVIGKAYQISGLVQQTPAFVEVYLAEKTTIVAGEPYLIKPTVTVDEFVVENVTIVNTQGTSISKSISGLSVTMQGVINGNGTTDGLYWVGNGGLLYNDSASKSGLRAYFNITTSSGIAPRMRVVAGENVETGIEDIITTDTPVKVIENGQLVIIRDGVKYNVQGVRL